MFEHARRMGLEGIVSKRRDQALHVGTVPVVVED
jgi:ATP-dependent DNA ligase